MTKILNLLAGAFFGIACAILLGIADSPKYKNIYSKEKASNLEQKSFSGQAIVTDGDSVKVLGNRIRLLGLDAPELAQKCLNSKKEKYYCGEKSKEFLLNLIDKKEVICYYEKKDVYNRFLGKCFIDKISINEEIVKNGWAVIYDYKLSTQKMNDLESAAKASKIGIWQGSFQLPKEYRKSKKKKSRH